MSEIRNEIKKLYILRDNYVYTMTSRKGKAQAFLAKNNEYYGVAIENINNITINEKFVNVRIRNMEFALEDKNIPVIFLFAQKDIELEKFMFLAENFLSLDAENEIIETPLSWVFGWKKMLGDSMSKMKVYDVIGELLSFKYVYSFDKEAHWQASQHGVHDIESLNNCYEIKSTVKREELKVSISSAFQLMSDKEEKLFFCRFEVDNTSALNIDNLVKEIIDLGYDEYMIEDELTKLGYPNGMSSRSLGFNLLEMREYDVTKDNFPIISLEDINSLGPKNNIVGFKLDLDLSGLSYKKIV